MYETRHLINYSGSVSRLSISCHLHFIDEIQPNVRHCDDYLIGDRLRSVQKEIKDLETLKKIHPFCKCEQKSFNRKVK